VKAFRSSGYQVKHLFMKSQLKNEWQVRPEVHALPLLLAIEFNF
jgi:hypothetical protein